MPKDFIPMSPRTPWRLFYQPRIVVLRYPNAIKSVAVGILKIPSGAKIQQNRGRWTTFWGSNGRATKAAPTGILRDGEDVYRKFVIFVCRLILPD